MGAGKTSVGRLLAGRLGWQHADLDRVIEERAGRSIPDIFRAGGESAFRTLEREATRQLAGRRRLVISPGGGWMTDPANREELAPGALFVYLKVSPDEVVRRVGNSLYPCRPLLEVDDPSAAARELLAAREPAYRRADLAVDTDGREIEEVVEEVAERLRRVGVLGDVDETGAKR